MNCILAFSAEALHDVRISAVVAIRAASRPYLRCLRASSAEHANGADIRRMCAARSLSHQLHNRFDMRCDNFSGKRLRFGTGELRHSWRPEG